MRIAVVIAALLTCISVVTSAHGSGAAITWNREVSRIVFDKCASCHRGGDTAFPLLTYQDAQPKATAIKAAVLARTMPPWGAVKGFGNFRNDLSLSQEQIEMITKWVDGGIRRGNNPGLLPPAPQFKRLPEAPASRVMRISGTVTLDREMTLDGLVPEQVRADQSFQIVAVHPNGHVEPLLWLHGYDPRYPHPFLLRTPLALPAGTVIRGVPRTSVVALLPRSPKPS